MYVLNITDDFNNINNCTDNGKEDINIIIKDFVLSLLANLLFFSLMGLVKYTTFEPLIIEKL